jgi:hypothetical protein
MVLFQVLTYTVLNDVKIDTVVRNGNLSKQTYVNYIKVMPKHTLQA